ncbi:MAG: hypothetical protein Q9217_005669 [Psora testacea]
MVPPSQYGADDEEEEESPLVTEPPRRPDIYVSEIPEDQDDDLSTSPSPSPRARGIMNDALDKAALQWRSQRETICRSMATHHVFIRAEECDEPFIHIGGERMLHRVINDEYNEHLVIDSQTPAREVQEVRSLLEENLRSEQEVDVWLEFYRFANSVIADVERRCQGFLEEIIGDTILEVKEVLLAQKADPSETSAIASEDDSRSQ